MKCPRCQFETASDSHFCPQCGTKIAPPDDGALSVTRSMPGPSNLHQPGHLVGGRYKLLNILGHGGMGVVFKAEDKKLRRMVALKFLPEEIGLDLQAKKRFFREAQAAAALDHPNICTVHEISEVEGRMFIVMNYVKGQSLKERIALGPMKLEEALDISTQVGEGLSMTFS